MSLADLADQLAVDPVLDAAILGLARRPLTPPPALPALAPLDHLALVAQRLRREAPVGPPLPAVTAALPDDPRPAPPPPLRDALLALTRGRRSPLLGPAVDALLRAGFRVHPFDLATVADLLPKGPPSGPSELAFLAVRAGKPVDTAPSELDDENWTDGSPAQRRDWLRARRAADPDAARALLEAALPSDPAAVRAELITALEVGLGLADVPLLTRLTKDRAAGVKQAAKDLLARTPGTPEWSERAARDAAQLRFTGGGLAFASATVRVGPRTFGDATLPDLAAALETTADALIGAVPAAHAPLAWALLRPTLRSGRMDLALELLRRNTGMPLAFFLAQGLAVAEELPLADRRTFADAVPLATADLGMDVATWRQIRLFVGGPAPAGAAAAFVASPAFLQLIAQLRGAGDPRPLETLLDAVVAAMPADVAPGPAALLSTLPLGVAPNARIYLNFLNLLASVVPR